MSIGTNIYSLRKMKNITQLQLAEKLGVSVQAVSKWENGQCASDVRSLIAAEIISRWTALCI